MNNFSKKHNTNESPDPSIKEKIFSHTKNSELPCAVAFKIAKELGVSAEKVGKTADLLNVRLTKCQLGLFGYTPEKKIIKPKNTIDPTIDSAIQKASVDNRLPCENAWDIAASFRVPRMTISSACESLGMKIDKCQLGAF